MNKLIKTGVYLTVMYVVPLVGAVERVLTFEILVLIIAGAILFLTQPDFNKKEGESYYSTDRGTVFFVIIAGIISQIAPVIEWGYRGQTGVPIRIDILSVIGLMITFFRYSFS